MRLPGHMPIIALLTVGLLVPSASAFSGSVLCLHTDGSTSVEVGNKKCCLSDEVDPRNLVSSDVRANGNNDDCHGCMDIALPSHEGVKRSTATTLRPWTSSCSYCLGPSAVSVAPIEVRGNPTKLDVSPPCRLPLRI